MIDDRTLAYRFRTPSGKEFQTDFLSGYNLQKNLETYRAAGFVPLYRIAVTQWKAVKR